jgi:hypothetical protein
MDEHFSIGVRAESVAVRLQTASEIREVVDLAVEHEPNGSVIGQERLNSVFRDIDDR